MAAGAVLALLYVASAEAATNTFADAFGPRLRRLGDALARSIARSFPVIAASPGVTFTFDFDAGAFVRSSELLGQLFLERAETVGRGKLNVSLDYQRVKIDTIDGKDIEDLHDTTPILQRRGRPATIPELDIDVDTHEVTTNITYGVTDDLDVNLIVPVVYSEFGLSARLSAPGAGSVPLRVRSSASGVGDLFLRGKYHVLRLDWLQLAGALVLRVPSGKKSDFQGTGSVEVEPLLIASTPPLAPTRWLRLRGYANGGMNFDAEDVDGSEGHWGIGLDWLASNRFTPAIALLARHAFRRIEPAGFFDVPRRDLSTGRTFVAPLFGIRDRRPDYYDLSIGGRVSLWRDTVIGFVNAIVPLNRDGVRSDVIPLAGIEAAF